MCIEWGSCSTIGREDAGRSLKLGAGAAFGAEHAGHAGMRILFTSLFIALGVNAFAQSTDGITENVELGGFILAPNPSHEEVTVIPTAQDLHMYVLFYDSEGHNVLSSDLRGTTRIDVTGLPDGAYMVSTVNGRGTPLDVHRLLVQH